MIKIENTLKTSVTYNGTGTQTRFDFPFDYLRKSFVHVSVNNTPLNTDQYTIDGRTVVFNNAPASGSVIRIYRETTTDRLVVWADASVLKASDMTIQQVQQLHILEEANDWTKSSSIVLNDDGTAWQGRNYRLTNISDPVDAKDVVTKGYMENVQGGFVTENTKIKDEATRQVGLAKDEKLKAQQYAEAASASKDLAKRWAEATDSPDYTTSKSAKTWAREAKDARDEAKDTAVNLGNPVVNITEDKGTVTVSKSDGSSSNFTTFPKFVDIPANADLNDYKQEGFYICKTNRDAATLQNCPAKVTFLMEVYNTSYNYEDTEDSWSHQRIITFNNSQVYTRAYTSWGDAGWYPWESIPAIGTILPFAGANSIPVGYLVCNGAAVSRETYASLFAVIGTTYGAGDGSTTFNLPNLTDKFIQGSDTAGTVKSAGLPNITGRRVASWGGGDYGGRGYTTGCFKQDADKTFPPTINGENWNGDRQGTGFAFDASLSNPIYGNSTTVQPPAVTMRYIIKY